MADHDDNEEHTPPSPHHQSHQSHHHHHHPAHPHPRSHSEAEAESAAGVVPSHGISIHFPDASHPALPARPYTARYMSAPVYQSPIRHHKRAPSKSQGVKETLNARSHYGSSDDDGASIHRINQYIIKQEIGRGSFGSVHLAVDQFGHEYAIKEFSKSRLRKRAQSNLLRKPNQQRRPGHLAAGLGFNSPLHRLSSSDKLEQDANNSLFLIKEEIAVMKKLDHNNLVSLIEVLDDPQEDSLYMVLEYCKKGVVMKVGLDERAEPYEDEQCRCWFRDMILGLEYLHHQGIIHRDIKPDNCLITEDDVLKIVDFGVSEMFEKASEMATAKSAGSPAFMPPELCVARHGQVSGRAADIWSMGVTLFCLRYGHIPFEQTGMLDLYESIRNDDLVLDNEQDRNFEDLMRRTLEKDPDKRITMVELREHPWVTKNGADPLLSAEENCADLVDPPSDAELEHAITGNMAHLMVVMKAVRRFKDLLFRRRPQASRSILGFGNQLVAPPTSIKGSASRSIDSYDRKPFDKILVTAGVHRDIDGDDEMERLSRDMDKATVHSGPDVDVECGAAQQAGEPDAHYLQRMESRRHHSLTHESDLALHREDGSTPDHSRSNTFPADDHATGHAHDPLTDTILLNIGTGEDYANDDNDGLRPVVSESPPGIDANIYEMAYQEEMKRIQEQRGHEASMYLTRRVDHREDLRSHSSILDSTRQGASRFAGAVQGLHKSGGGGLAGLVRMAQAKEKERGEEGGEEEPPLQAPRLDGLENGEVADGSMPGAPAGLPAHGDGEVKDS
ncbi:calcium/calmodulin-dependent protein kinase kinase cmkC-like [Teratosphaeria destructans]|uniref:Calcium/calmodulin-dependent protein kinase kinase cmkC-like n=1 Tax=Teratosphaeria destructans TaxID=418781 RepID=A0A9W7W203_9PEZI|nr:calcium/calmodulin-dependent protein kinase kinase cmkC-like [Teratosphaeria destructans]